MHELEQVTGFQWDAGNAGKNRKHEVTDAEIEQVFFCVDLLIIQDTRHSESEPRFHALGETLSGRTLHVTFTLRSQNTLVRAISARTMSRKERTVYEAQAEKPA